MLKFIHRFPFHLGIEFIHRFQFYLGIRFIHRFHFYLGIKFIHRFHFYLGIKFFHRFHFYLGIKFIHLFHFYLGIKFKLVPFPSSGKINESYVLGSTKSTYCPYPNWHNVARSVGIIYEMFNMYQFNKTTSTTLEWLHNIWLRILKTLTNDKILVIKHLKLTRNKR